MQSNVRPIGLWLVKIAEHRVVIVGGQVSWVNVAAG